MIEEATSKFWREVSPGDMVALSDAQTIIARMKENKGLTPENYEIKSILTCKQFQGLAEWRFIQLGDICLLAKLVDNNVHLAVLRPAPDWEPSTRKELFEKDILFMFKQPEKSEFEFEELRYVDEINETSAEVNGDIETIFYIKPQGELHSNAEHNPTQSGIGRQIATVVEYAAEANKGLIDTEFVILEVGVKPSNGVIKFLVGRPIASVDVNVMRRK